MIGRMISVALLAGLVTLALLAPDAQSAAPTRDSEHPIHLVYGGDRGPLLLELTIRIDGQSHQVAWEKLIDHLFAYLDRNKDGVLSKQEAAGAPPPEALGSGLGGFNSKPSTVKPGPDGKVTRRELAEYYRTSGLSPFLLSYTARDTGVRFLGAPRPVSGEALSTRLFELLDKDKDSKLSRKELEAAENVIGPLDADEDELVDRDELQGKPALTNDAFAVAFIDSMDVGMPANRRPLYQPTKVDQTLARTLLARYGKKGEKTLNAKALGWAPEILAALDRDGDGNLDLEELARFANRKADLTLTIDLGKGATPSSVRVEGKTPAGVRATARTDSVVLEIDNVRLDLKCPSSARNMGFEINVEMQFITIFQMADTDNNGYLDKAEAEKNGAFRNLFAVMDRDNDGMLYEKEVRAYVQEISKLRDVAKRSAASLVVTDEGKGLFDLLDSNGDGKLGVRELRAAGKLLETLIRDKDGLLGPNDVPRRYQGALEAGVFSSGGGRGVVAFAGGMRGETVRTAPQSGPVWFRRMDRNRDGDVSQKEFLGTLEHFRTIDADRDGLISVAEAEAFDRTQREKK